ncbi:MAG: FtsX-like permease family protein, partial [Nitrospinaceae bacterium]
MRFLKYFFDLFTALILRPLWRDPFRTGITILGVAIGVSVFLSIQLANRQTLWSFEESIDLVLGRADAVIEAEGLPFDETHFTRLLTLREWIKPYPVIQGYGVETSSGEVVEILGADLLQDSGIRDYSLKTTGAGLKGLLPLILDPASIILPGKFIPGAAFAPGQDIRFLINGKHHTLHVNAVLENKGIARALNGNFALMDIAGAQQLFGKVGQLDRIDVEFVRDADFDRMREKMREVLPEFLRIDRPERKNRQVEKMLRAFQYNLSALSFVALLVGLYLIYNMISLSVVRRRMEIGAMRAMGASSGLIAAIFLFEAGILGALGSLGGIALGHHLARFSLEAVNVTINNLYVPTNVTDVQFHWNQMGPYFLLGVGLALAAALIPAYDAASTPPTLVMRRGSYDLKVFRGNRRLTAWAVAVLLLAAVASFLPPVHGFPFFGFLSVALVVLGLSLLAPAALLATRTLLSGPCQWGFQGEGLLASRNLAQNVGRNAICVSSLAIAFMMIVSMAIMVHSFRQTVVVWIGQTLRADLFVRAVAGRNIDYQYTLPISKIDALKQVPGVKAVDVFRAINITYQDAPAILAAGDFTALSRYGNLVIKDGPPAAALAALPVNQNRAIVSEAFALKH